jgi:hypothetical protein
MNTDNHRGHYRLTLPDERTIERIAELSGLTKKSDVIRAAVATAHAASHNSKHGRLVLRNNAIEQQQGVYVGPGISSAVSEAPESQTANASGTLGVRHSHTEVQQLDALVEFGFGRNKTEVIRRSLYLLLRIVEARHEGWELGYVLPGGEFVQILLPELGDCVTPDRGGSDPPRQDGHVRSSAADRVEEGEKGLIRVAYAPLPDTAFLFGYAQLMQKEFDALCDRHNVRFAFEKASWKDLGSRFDVDAADVAGVFGNRWIVDRAPQHKVPLEFFAPYLGVFTGHYIFVQRDLAQKCIERKHQALIPTPGSEQSLHAVFKYRCGLSAMAKVVRTVEIACQEDTDWQMATRIMRNDYGLADDTYRSLPVDSLDGAFEQFLSGGVTGFIGGLSHASLLLTQFADRAVVLAGPGDIVCPSINSLITPQGLLKGGREVGGAVCELWSAAVTWFNETLLGDPQVMGRYLMLLTPEPPAGRLPAATHLAELIRKHVRLFASPRDAEDYEEQFQLGKKYEWLCGAYLVGGGKASAWGDQLTGNSAAPTPSAGRPRSGWPMLTPHDRQGGRP